MRISILAAFLGATFAGASPLVKQDGEAYPIHRFRDQPGFGKVVCTATSLPYLYGQFFYGASYEVDEAYWIAMRKCRLTAVEPLYCYITNCIRSGHVTSIQLLEASSEGTSDH